MRRERDLKPDGVFCLAGFVALLHMSVEIARFQQA
jgi:hypothetical protein